MSVDRSASAGQRTPRAASALDRGDASAAVWRAFDLQLATYAALLLCFGLAMAYSNTATAESASSTAGSVFLRGLMWTAIAVAVFLVATTFDYHWLKTFAWPLYLVQLGLLVLTLAIGSGVGGTSRWVSIFGLQFQFSELAKVLMIVVLANYLGSRVGRLGSLWSILGAGILAGPPFAPRPAAARPRHGARLRRDPRGDALHVGRQPALAGRARGRRHRGVAVRVDLRPRGLPEGAS